MWLLIQVPQVSLLGDLEQKIQHLCLCSIDLYEDCMTYYIYIYKALGISSDL